MKGNSNVLLTELLKQVQKTYGFPIAHSKDCDNVSLTIQEKTGERISGSTLKRLYGFSKTTSSPNKYTLNTLAKYLGKNDFDEFKQAFGVNTNTDFIEAITKETMQNKSDLIPKTLWETEFDLPEKLNNFLLDTNKKCSVITGYGGVGKSTQVTRWVQSIENQKILYLDAFLLRKLIGENSIYQWFQAFSEKPNIVIIDSIDESAYNHKEVHYFMKELSQFVQQLNTKVKLLLVMRPYTWLKYRSMFTDTSIWFNADFVSTKLNDVCNAPQLKEKGILRSPFFKTISVKESRQKNNTWSLLNSFFRTKVWSTAHAFEKRQFFDAILTQTNFGINDDAVERKNIEDLIVRYKKAHLDLLSLNVLSERKHINKYGSFSATYQFGHSLYFDFLILADLLEKHNGFNAELIQFIGQTYENERKISLLKLAVSYALDQQLNEVANLFDFIELEEVERQALMIEMADIIREDVQLQKHLLPHFLKSESGRKYFIERWIDEEYLNGFYGELLKSYLIDAKETQDLVFANSLLYYNDFLQGKKSSPYIKKILLLNPQEIKHPFVLGRYYMSLFLFQMTKDGSIQQKLQEEIQEILNQKPREQSNDLPVHSFGFEHNILHAEFLTGHYIFSKNIFESTRKSDLKLNHSNDYDILLFQIFKAKFEGSQFNISSFNLNRLHPWYKHTVNLYLNWQHK